MPENNLTKHLKTVYGDFFSKFQLRSASKQIVPFKNAQKLFFVIGVPGSLHIVELCLKYIPTNQKIVFIANGLSEWEIQWASKNLHTAEMLLVPMLLEHGQVLDFLLDEMPNPFGILDYDCFVFNQEIFKDISILEPEVMLNAVFVHSNPKLNIDIPETFMMYFNPSIIRAVQSKYHARSNIIDYDLVSKKAKKKLWAIGIDGQQYPEEYKNYFDSTRLWYALGIAEGYKCQFVRRMPTVSEPNDQIFHVGASSQNQNTKTKWALRGSYFWRRCLETCSHEDLKTYYFQRYGKMSSTDLLALNPELSSKINPAFFPFAEKLILGKIAGCSDALL